MSPAQPLTSVDSRQSASVSFPAPESPVRQRVTARPDARVRQAFGPGRTALAAPEVRLLGPAPLLRLRGRHRAQLLAKTDSPRAFASRAAAVLARAAPAMRRDGLSAVVDVDPQSL